MQQVCTVLHASGPRLERSREGRERTAALVNKPRSVQIPSAPHSPDPTPQARWREGGREGPGTPGTPSPPLTLQREEEQEEAQHPDAVQPVGPHVSAALEAMLPRALRLCLFARALSRKTRRSFRRLPSGLCRLRQPGRSRLLPQDGRTQNGFALLRKSASPGLDGRSELCLV